MRTRINKEAINRSQLAREVGTNQSHISRILSGDRKPSITMAVKIAKNLNITVDELIELLGIN